MVFEAILEFFSYLIGNFGYIGVFLVSIISNASIIFPVPAFIIVTATGFFLNPWLVGLFAGIGGGIGEVTAYYLGYGGNYVIEEKLNKSLDEIEKWARKQKWMGLAVFIFAATPLADDIVGIACGIVQYPVKKFLIYQILGKIVFYTALALFGNLFNHIIF